MKAFGHKTNASKTRTVVSKTTDFQGNLRCVGPPGGHLLALFDGSDGFGYW
jgi:hypothetical protein